MVNLTIRLIANLIIRLKFKPIYLLTTRLSFQKPVSVRMLMLEVAVTMEISEITPANIGK